MALTATEKYNRWLAKKRLTNPYFRRKTLPEERGVPLQDQARKILAAHDVSQPLDHLQVAEDLIPETVENFKTKRTDLAQQVRKLVENNYPKITLVPGQRLKRIIQYIGGNKSVLVDVDDVAQQFNIEPGEGGINIRNLKRLLRNKGYKIKVEPVSRPVLYALKKTVTNPEGYVKRNELQKLYEIIQGYNSKDAISKVRPDGTVVDVKAIDMTTEAGFGKDARKSALRPANYLIDKYFLSTADKINTAMDEMLMDGDIKLNKVIESTEKLSKRFQVPTTMVTRALRNNRNYKHNKQLINLLNNKNATRKFVNSPDYNYMTLDDFIFEADAKKLEPSINTRNPQGELQKMAYRHWKQGGKKINWITDPRKTPQGDWVFEYKGKQYNSDNLALSRNDPNFKSFWKTDAQIKKYNDHLVTNPEILRKLGFQKPTSMKNIMSRTLGYGTGSEGYYGRTPIDKDHFNIKEEPFEVRPMDTRINRAAGRLQQRLIEGNLTAEELAIGKTKIGYDYRGQIDFDDPKAFNESIKRDLDFALKGKLREKGFLRTPDTIVKEHLAQLPDLFEGPQAQKSCAILFRGVRVRNAKGPGCGDQVREALQKDPDAMVKKINELPAQGGFMSRAKAAASNILKKVPKGGRLGAILAGAGAVGAGTWAMMGDATAEETPTTEQMSYNATEGKFVNAEGDPETQEGVLNWIADHPIYSGLAPIPIGIGAGLGAEAMGAKQVGNFFKSMKFILPPAYAAEKLYQYKQGQDMGEMFANPIDAVWAMALDNKASRARKWDYYKNLAQKRVGIGPLAKGAVEAQQLGLKPSSWKNIGRATMAPRSFGTSLVFPFAGPKAGAGLGMKVFRGAARMLPLGPIPMALMAGSMAWDKYKFNKKIGDHVDALRAQGVVSEEDAETMNTIYKQGWLGTTAIGAKLLGSEELMFEGEMLDIEAQKKILSGMKDFYGGREQMESYQRAGERQEDFFSWFSGGGRVGLAEGGNKKPFGSMTRRSFLKWLVGSIAAGVAAVSGRGLKQAAKTATATVAKTPAKFIGVEGMPAWFPRAVYKIKAHGKLIEMADKHYTQGDIYEMMIPVARKYLQRSKPGEGEVYITKAEYEKVVMEENPLTGEIDMHWTGTDNFGDDAVRHISFKPGSAGYQKFGVDDPEAAARGITEFRRVKVEEPEFSYTQPDQSQPYRDDIEYLDIFEEGDEIVGGLEKMTQGKGQMVTKDGNVINTSEYGPAEKVIDKEFQKKIYKDIEGEEANYT